MTPKWLRGVPSVALIHQVCREIWWHEAPFPVAVAGRFLLERKWLRAYADTPTFTLSPSSKASLEHYGLQRVSVVPVGCEMPDRPDVPREPVPTALFVGRLASNKRPADALRAFELAREDVPGLRMWFVGSGPETARLERRAPEGVTFMGQVDGETKRELMARAHVLLVTSVREGWGLVVDEAAAMGTPTIGYAVPGLLDSVPAAGGRLVDPRPEALAQELRTWLPSLVDKPRSSGWTTGTRPWAEVADTFLAMCADRAGVAP
jgi:glycosyltransferase involved in cell wall biosynthesis